MRRCERTPSLRSGAVRHSPPEDTPTLFDIALLLHKKKTTVELWKLDEPCQTGCSTVRR